jgi:hypothetical protein
MCGSISRRFPSLHRRPPGILRSSRCRSKIKYITFPPPQPPHAGSRGAFPIPTQALLFTAPDRATVTFSVPIWPSCARATAFHFAHLAQRTYTRSSRLHPLRLTLHSFRPSSSGNGRARWGAVPRPQSLCGLRLLRPSWSRDLRPHHRLSYLGEAPPSQYTRVAPRQAGHSWAPTTIQPFVAQSCSDD